MASECQERNGLVGARGVLLLRTSICQLAADWRLASEQSLEDQGLVRIWEMILGRVTSSGPRGEMLALVILYGRMPWFC